MTSLAPVPNPAPPPEPPYAGDLGKKILGNGGGGSSTMVGSARMQIRGENVSYRNIVTGEHGEDVSEGEENETDMLDQDEFEDVNSVAEGIIVKEGTRGGYECPTIVLSKD